MKKMIVLVLFGLMIISSFCVVYAEEPVDALSEDSIEQGQVMEDDRLQAGRLKEFAEELHQVNTLRSESAQLKIQVIEKQDQLLDLYIAAREAGNKEVLKAAKEERKQVKGMQENIKALHEQATVARKAFREAVKNNDMETANSEITKLIDIHNSINNLKEEKLEVLDKVIDILS